MSDKMREEFEAAVLNSELLPCNSIVKIEGGDEYSSVLTGVAWLSWQISRAALCVELPESHNRAISNDFDDGFEQSLSWCKDSLDDAGVRYK